MNLLLSPLAACFRWGVEVRAWGYNRGWLSSDHPGRPVISVGNLSVGGTGKTPLVAYVAKLLLAQGLAPSILTRGYRRESRGKEIVIDPGEARQPDPRRIGDEAALLARAVPKAPILISADRVLAARLAEQKFHVDAHILDDAFQYLAIQRDLDIVLIDVTKAFSPSAVLPAGRLREPPSALRRADVVLLTRTELVDADGIEAQIHSINPRARVFRCSTKLEGLVDLCDGRRRSCREIFEKPVMAFAGIGNPQAFFANLRQWGAEIAAERCFGDHHRYSRDDVAQIMARFKQSGAHALITTEKDALNWPSDAPHRDTPLVACAIRPEISEASVFEDAIVKAVRDGRVVA